MGEMDGENGLGHVEELDEGAELEVVEFTDEDGKTVEERKFTEFTTFGQPFAFGLTLPYGKLTVRVETRNGLKASREFVTGPGKGPKVSLELR